MAGSVIDQFLGIGVGAMCGPGGPFSPTKVPGLEAYYRYNGGLFQDAAKTTPASSDTDPIGAWEDNSGKGRDVTQSTASKKSTLNTISGRKLVRYDGVNDILKTASTNISSTNGHTVFIVVDINHATAAQTLVRHRVNAAYGLAPGFSIEVSAGVYANVLYEDASGNSMTLDGGTQPASSFTVITVLFESSDITIFHDGVDIGGSPTVQAGATPLGTVDGNTSLGIGNNVDDEVRTLSGDVRAVLVYGRALNATERQDIENFLADWT